MLKCNDIEALLCDYVDGTLGGAEQAQVDGHVKNCDVCADMLAASQSAVHFMAAVADVEPPPALITRVLYKTQVEKPAAAITSSRQCGRARPGIN